MHVSNWRLIHRELVMKIERIFAHRVELPLVEGSYKWSSGKSVSVFDSTIIGIETDGGLVGFGEVCPLGPFYLPAYAEGVAMSYSFSPITPLAAIM